MVPSPQFGIVIHWNISFGTFLQNQGSLFTHESPLPMILKGVERRPDQRDGQGNRGGGRRQEEARPVMN